MIKLTRECGRCGATIEPNWEKLALALGGSAAVSLLAAAFGLAGGGWIALLGAAVGGSAAARQLLQLKAKLLEQGQRLGSFFKCGGCHRDVSILEVFADESEPERPATPPALAAGHAEPVPEIVRQHEHWLQHGANEACPCGSGRKYRKCHGMPAN